MRFHLVSDNEDTLVGMRLAGVDGVLVKEPELAQKAINEAMNNPSEIAVVLLTEGVVAMCSEFVYDLKLNRKRPLIVEIPEGAATVAPKILLPVMSARLSGLRFSFYFAAWPLLRRNGG